MQIAPRLRPGQLVVLESTTYPGTTDESSCPILEASGLQAGQRLLPRLQPRARGPGQPELRHRTIPKVVGGSTPPALDAGASRSTQVGRRQVVPVSSAAVAEARKILENTYRAVNIALVNELKMLFDRMGIDVWEVIDAAKTKPFGFQAFYPGPGLGGHCIPIDPFYLTWKAREYGVYDRASSSWPARSTPRCRTTWSSSVAEALNDRRQAAQGRARCWSWAWPTRRTSTTRASRPRSRSWKLLKERGAVVAVQRPALPGDPRKTRSTTLASARTGESTPEVFADYDVVVVVTAHDVFEDANLYRRAKLVVDTRNIVAPALGGAWTGTPRLVKA